MAGTVPTITPNSITGITGLGHKPVYFLKLNGAPNATLVIKGESVAPNNNDDALVSISWSSKIMKNVNNHLVNSKIMTPNEIAEFTRAARATFQPQSDQAFHLNVPYNWVKMPKVDDLSDTNYIVTDNGGWGREDSTLIKKAIKRFVEDATWYELGKVVAVDIFNGNNDRFNTQGDWVNKGNIMFVNNSVIGMDTWDPSGTLGMTTESNLARGGGFDALRILTDQNRMQQYALAVTNSVGYELSRGLQMCNLSSVSIKLPDNSISNVSLMALRTLFVPMAGEFQRGMTDGVNALRTYLLQKVQQYPVVPTHTQRNTNMTIGGNRGQGNRPTNSGFQMGHHRGNVQQQPQQPGKRIPQGILDRMRYLGWIQ